VPPAVPTAATGHDGVSAHVVPIDDAALAALLANDADRVRVVNLWATWCGPCVDELPELAALAAERPDVDVALVSVDHPDDGPWIAQFAGQSGISLEIRHLAVRDAPMLANVVRGVIPVTLVLAPGGVVRARFDGRFDATALRTALGPPP
jgi:thiol-disulfide isomerase/thioredoxin